MARKKNPVPITLKGNPGVTLPQSALLLSYDANFITIKTETKKGRSKNVTVATRTIPLRNVAWWETSETQEAVEGNSEPIAAKAKPTNGRKKTARKKTAKATAPKPTTRKKTRKKKTSRTRSRPEEQPEEQAAAPAVPSRKKKKRKKRRGAEVAASASPKTGRKKKRRKKKKGPPQKSNSIFIDGDDDLEFDAFDDELDE